MNPPAHLEPLSSLPDKAGGDDGSWNWESWKDIGRRQLRSLLSSVLKKGK
jgi:hypothetical protein